MDIRRSLNRFWRQQCGGVTVFNVVLLSVIFGMAGIAIDSSNAYRTRAMLQATADAAATSAAFDLPNEDAARATAVAYAKYLMPPVAHGAVVRPNDVIFGQWDIGTGVFDRGATPANAIWVRTARHESNANRLPTYLMKFVGVNSLDIAASAIAVFEGEPTCSNIIANNTITVGQDLRVGAGVCIYARNGINTGQDPQAHPDGRIGTLAPFNISTGQSPRIPEQSKFEADIVPHRALNINALIDNLEANGRPGYTTRVVTSLPSNLIQSSIYIVNGNVNIGDDRRERDVIIAVRGNLKMGQDARIGSDMRNTPTTCPTDAPMGVYVSGNFQTGQDPHFNNVDLVVGNDMKVGQDIRTFHVTIEVGNNFHSGQDPQFSNCPIRRIPDTLPPMPGEPPASAQISRLVR